MKATFENKEQNIFAKEIKGFRASFPAYHDHVEIVYVMAGALGVCIGGKNRMLKAGEMSVCFPYQIHSYEQAPSARVLLVMFPTKAAGVFSGDLLKFSPREYCLTPAPYMHMLLQRLVSCEEEGAKELADVYVSALAGELLKQMPMEMVEQTDTNTVQKLLLYCQEHYKEPISVTTAAKAVHISERYVTKIFAQRQGCSFRKYINRLRIMDIKKLLQESDRTITDIMLACGFNNQSTFNRVFFEEVGISPREFRKTGNL